MTFEEWLSETQATVREDGLHGLKDALYQLYLGMWRRIGRVYNYGIPIYEREWDVLIVLDACRADLMASVADKCKFASCETVDSVASTSAEWMEKNFNPRKYHDELRKTAYVTGNPFTDEVFFRHECPDCGTVRGRVPGERCSDCGSNRNPERIADHEFYSLEEVWQHAWDDGLGTIPPTPLTDRAIMTWRNESPERMIVHYMQPHHPFVDSSIQTSLSPDGFGEMGRESVWNLLREGAVDRDRVWKDYQANLEYVLEDVSRLLENIDAAQVVITADHGNSVGEWGLYGHYRNVPHAGMKHVPWCETSAENVRKDKLERPSERETDSQDVQSRLEDLGYL